MAPSGAGIGLFPRTTPLEAITQHLSEEQRILLTHLVVWLLAFVSGVFLALRFFAIWYRKSVLLIDDGLLAASWVRNQESLPLTHASKRDKEEQERNRCWLKRL